jgi:hypothetical protein
MQYKKPSFSPKPQLVTMIFFFAKVVFIEKKPQYPTKGHAPHSPLFIFPCRPPQGTTGPDDDEGEGIFIIIRTRLWFSPAETTPRETREYTTLPHAHSHTHTGSTHVSLILKGL